MGSLEIKRRVLDLLFPPKCPFCRCLVEQDGMVCASCLSQLPKRDNLEIEIPFVEKAVVPFFYQDEMREALRRFKFSGLPGYRKAFAPLLAWAIRNAFDDQEYDIVSYVPISRKRMRQRGYNQAQLLAEEVAILLDKPALQTLEKYRDNRPQSEQKSADARRSNVIGVYRPYHPERYQEKCVLLIDDIATTGATFSECAATLQTAGATMVLCAAMAHGHYTKGT